MADDLAAADVVLLTGDLTHFGHRDDARQVVEAVRSHNRNVLAVSGNCDYPDVEDYLTAEDVGLHRRHVAMEGTAFVGLSGSVPCPGRTPNEFSDGRLRAFLDEAAAGLDPGVPMVLVSHQPPLDTAADLVRGRHVGSRSVREFIEKYQPLVCFTGHIHEGRGIDSIGRTQIANPGPLREGGYTYAEISSQVELLEIRGV
jgi:Icc-related predicted phosphoesterase